LNGWTVCRFHRARVGGAERQAERQLPARLQDEGNDRGLEAHKITALTFAWGPIGQTPDFYPRNAHGAVTVARGGDARKGKPPKADKDRKFIIAPHFAGRKSLM
jgi:hypothetical protein